MKKRWLIVPIALFLLESIYFVGTWIFLNRGPLFHLLNTDPSDIWLEYDSAYSPFPGLVYLRNVRFRAQDANMQLHFTLDRARVEVDLLALTRKEFVTDGLRGDGLDFRVRFRRELKEMKPEVVKSLPEIPGLPDLKKPPPEPPPAPGPWRIKLKNVSVTGIRSVWLDVIRLRGDSEVHGGFELRPGRGAGVFPAHLVIHHGEVTLRGAPAARVNHGDISGHVDSFQKDKATGLGIFQFVTGRAQLDGEIEDVGFLNHYVEDVKWLTFEGGGGPLKADLSADKGKLLPGSHLSVQSQHMVVKLYSQEAVGDATVRWNIDGGKQPLGKLGIQFDNYRLQNDAVKNARIEGRHLAINITTADLDLTRKFEMEKIDLAIPEARITDCRYFNAYFPRGSGFKIIDGSGKISGNFSASRAGRDEDRGELHIDVARMGAEFEKYRMKGAVNAKVLLHHGNLNTGIFEVVGTTVDLSKVEGAPVGKKPAQENTGWWGTVLISRGTLRLRDHLGINAELSVRGRDARPVFAIFAAQSGLPGWLGKVLSFQNLTALFGLEVRDDFLAIHGGKVKGEGMSLSGWLHKEEESKAGRLLLELGPLAAGVSIDDSGSHIRLNDATKWFQTQQEP